MIYASNPCDKVRIALTGRRDAGQLRWSKDEDTKLDGAAVG